MVRRAATILAITGSLLLPLPVPASGLPCNLRSPQVVFLGAALQGDLANADGGIDVSTDQIDNACWVPGVVGCNCTIGIVSMDPGGPVTAGVYSTSEAVPALLPVFPAGASQGWFSVYRRRADSLVVTTFDERADFIGSATYGWLDPNHVGLYVQGSGGTWFTEDARNGGEPQALSFAGTGVNQGGVFLCFERSAYNRIASTFTGLVLQVAPLCEVPAGRTTWGRLKTLYR